MFHLPLGDKGKPSDKLTGNEGWKNDPRQGKGCLEFAIFESSVKDFLLKTTPALPVNETRMQQLQRFATPVAPANLQGVVFPPGFIFAKIASELNVDFAGATFGNNVFFTGISLRATTDFTSAKFDGAAYFHGTRFGDEVKFNGVTFMGVADFTDAIFGISAQFIGVEFKGNVSFADTAFGDRANFKNATFNGDAAFWISNDKSSQHEFQFQRIYFPGAMFKSACSFVNRAFTGEASFNDAKFHDRAEFHGCTFHQGMSFHGAKFLKTKGGYDAEGFEIDSETEALERAYRTLKLGMETLRARNEEAYFFAKEMECRRNRRDVGLFEHFVAFSYKKLSNYGQSILKPLVWLTGFTALMWCVYYVTGEKTLTDLVLDVISGKVESWEIAKFTIEQMFRPFFVWSATSGDKAIDLVRYNPFLIPLLASLQSLATLSLLALFLLALRRRFKMD